MKLHTIGFDLGKTVLRLVGLKAGNVQPLSGIHTTARSKNSLPGSCFQEHHSHRKRTEKAGPGVKTGANSLATRKPSRH